jgi:hypothetical protein
MTSSSQAIITPKLVKWARQRIHATYESIANARDTSDGERAELGIG